MSHNTQIFVNLPVEDLDRPMEFFGRPGFNFNLQFTDVNAACLVISENIYVMLLTKAMFAQFTKKEIADAQRTTEVLVVLSVGSKERVDQLAKITTEHGGSVYNEPQDHGWMYQRSFADPDGHQWEVLYMDMSAMPQTQNVYA
jgi:predicted lactoylglutathione lyase